MNCPTCGLLNVPTAQVCIHCKSSLVDAPPLVTPTKNIVMLRKAKILSASMNSSGAQLPHTQENEEWRDQLSLKLEQIKAKPSGLESIASIEIVETMRNREFIRPCQERPEETSSSAPSLIRVGFHPLAEKTLQKLDRVQRSAGTPPVADRNTGTVNPDLETFPTPPKKFASQGQNRKSGKIERIEIDLNQRTLPFDSFEENQATSPEDLIRNGITAAGVPERLRAGAIDGLFLTGSFLFFLLIILFVPEFKLLTKPSLLALMIVGGIFFVGYHYLFIALGGRTLGMEYEQLHVVNFEGHPISVVESRLRTLGYLISLGCFGLGYLWAFFDPDRLTWHDKISKTLIVEREGYPQASSELPSFERLGQRDTR